MNRAQRELVVNTMKAARECTFQVSDALIKGDDKKAREELAHLKRHIAAVEKELK